MADEEERLKAEKLAAAKKRVSSSRPHGTCAPLVTNEGNNRSPNCKNKRRKPTKRAPAQSLPRKPSLLKMLSRPNPPRTLRPPPRTRNRTRHPQHRKTMHHNPNLKFLPPRPPLPRSPSPRPSAPNPPSNPCPTPRPRPDQTPNRRSRLA